MNHGSALSFSLENLLNKKNNIKKKREKKIMDMDICRRHNDKESD